VPPEAGRNQGEILQLHALVNKGSAAAAAKRMKRLLQFWYSAMQIQDCGQRERSSDPLGLESCAGHRELLSEA
jgi:hypothetical protein